MKYKLLTLLLAVGSMAFAQKLDMEAFKNMAPRSIGPAGMSGRITAIDVVTDEPDVMYVGSASGGVWKSTSGGIDWEPIFN
ncbi:MAG: xyloglucanase precursor, partial [Marinoscillum sp.]